MVFPYAVLVFIVDNFVHYKKANPGTAGQVPYHTLLYLFSCIYTYVTFSIFRIYQEFSEISFPGGGRPYFLLLKYSRMICMKLSDSNISTPIQAANERARNSIMSTDRPSSIPQIRILAILYLYINLPIISLTYQEFSEISLPAITPWLLKKHLHIIHRIVSTHWAFPGAFPV
jgi:hypothetical protein